MATKADAAELRLELHPFHTESEESFRTLRRELGDINKRLDLIEQNYANLKGITKEIDEIRAEVRALQRGSTAACGACTDARQSAMFGSVPGSRRRCHDWTGGVGRSLLSMPLRLLVSLFLGWVAASAAVIYLEVSHASLVDGIATRVGISGLSALIGMRALGTFIVFFIVMLVLGHPEQ